ncbi:MAG: hypothetical protein ABH950_03330 [Candidatus Altiarchaeota archaeon]
MEVFFVAEEGKLDYRKAEFIIMGVVITTLIGGAFLLGFSAGYNWAIMQVLP